MSVEKIKKLAKTGDLVVVLGAGVSLALTSKSKVALSWSGLVKSGLDYGKDRGHINPEQHARNTAALNSNDIDDLLGVAEFIGRKLEAPNGDEYARWLRGVFEKWKPEPGGMQNALHALRLHKVPIATLNYDTLAEQSTGLSSIEFSATQKMMMWSRRELEGILHLHGIWTDPKNCIFGIRDYQTAVNDEVRSSIQRSISSLKSFLFIGCGETFVDPNFSALIKWLRQNLGASAPTHYALVNNAEVAPRLADPAWRGFVDPLGYGASYADLPGFLLNCFPTQSTSSIVAAKKIAAIHATQVIESYKSFLLRDCGEMTIEGMRADMDTAQRKFNIEKLFVPLDVQPLPPIFSPTDPQHEEKLKQWHKDNAKPVPFSEIFKKTKKIVLLALPGGGKTLLLKRLAVAYADASRRASSNDKLPSLELVPIIIKCREWKEHIRKPLPVMLRNISSITGDYALEGLFDALEKPLKAGLVLILVDGLDEIHDDGDRTVFVENLEKFLEMYPRARLLVTSREAGFDLIAPCLSRFCTKYRIAPLNAVAIGLLCEHWHRLMGGGTPEATAEAKLVLAALTSSDSLRRLAENPLLCTMLLVVKHGFGRLPPDRVTLYDRAVEMLLDTWNIKGHEALNVKEALPQLACVAFEMLRSGKQTATENEILKILEDARTNLPTIGRYAKDSPYEFLKRVELRSSLILEGGLTNEGGKVVPFYQFRHLTFQEYLSAVAAVEGYVLAAKQPVSVLNALSDHLLSDEWKEVIPMAAVLARSQATPLLEALVRVAETEKNKLLANGRKRRLAHPAGSVNSKAAARIVRSMVEEANFSPELLGRAAPIVALYANGISGNEYLQTLSQGPYGAEVRAAAFDIYLNDSDDKWPNIRNTLALLEAFSEPSAFWLDPATNNLLMTRLDSQDEATLIKTMLSIAGSFWNIRERSVCAASSDIYYAIESKLFDDRRKVQLAALWTWGFWRHLQPDLKLKKPIPSNKTINFLCQKFLAQDADSAIFGDLGISDLVGISRDGGYISLSAEQERVLRGMIEAPTKIEFPNLVEQSAHETSRILLTLVRIAFILKDKFSDAEVKSLLLSSELPVHQQRNILDIRAALGISSPKTRSKIPRQRSSAAI